MKLPSDIRARFRKYGRMGGLARAKALSDRERSQAARRGALKRWIKERFGADSFSELALPGSEIVDAGLYDLAEAEETENSLLVAIAMPRLAREGVPLPRQELPWTDPEFRLYRRISRASSEELAHQRYTARVRRIDSFANALRLLKESR